MATYFGNPDFMRPIRTANRDEVFLVEFFRVYKNTNMSIMRNIAKRAQEDLDTLSIFPNFKTLMDLHSNEERYSATVLYNKPEDFISFLLGDSKDQSLIQTCLKLFQEPYDLSQLHNTRLEFTIRNLLENSSFLRKVYFVADKFSREVQQYLIVTLGADAFEKKRIQLVEGPVVECFSAFPDITTAFISNFSDFQSVYQHSPECLNGKLIVIADGYENFEIYGDKKDDIRYKGMDIFQKLHDEKRAEGSYMFPYAIEKETQ